MMMDKIFKLKSNNRIADILRSHITDYQKQYHLHPEQYKVVFDILNCRTRYLGGHVERCNVCGTERHIYHSCRNRHCPTCQQLPREQWLAARKSEILPVSYFHNVFTLPHKLNPIILLNKKVMLNLLFQSTAETLTTFAENEMGGKLGFLTILHTWDQLLKPHFHLHCLVPGGAVTENGTKWIPCKRNYLFNMEALGLVFRGKFIYHMSRAFNKGLLKFPGGPLTPYAFKSLKKSLYEHKWVVDVRESFQNPEHVIEYLGRYTHRVAISNSRIRSFKNGEVTFTYKDRKTNQKKEKSIGAVEFIKRFLRHTLPKRFVRIRHYGFLSNRNKERNLSAVRRIMGVPARKKPEAATTVQEAMQNLIGIDITVCPCCRKGRMCFERELTKYIGDNAASIIRPPFTSQATLAAG
jgi:hypothetical protein